MPFKSEAQRKYLWANEPAIARDWTDTYGSRIQKDDGGVIQDGYLNYTKGLESVTIPKKFKARKDATPTHLAYITEAEAAQLKKQNKGTPHKGPKGIPSYDDYDASAGKYGRATSGATMSGIETGGSKSETGAGGRTDTRALGYTPQEVAAISQGAQSAAASGQSGLGRGIIQGIKNFPDNFRRRGLRRNLDYYMGGKKLDFPMIAGIFKGPQEEEDYYTEFAGLSPLEMQARYAGTLSDKEIARVQHMSSVLGQDKVTQSQFEDAFYGPKGPPDLSGGGGGDGPQAEWQRLGYPSYEAYQAAMGRGASVDDTTTTASTSDLGSGHFKVPSQYVLAEGGRAGYQMGNMVGAEMEGAEMEGAVMQSQEVIKELYDAFIAQGLSPEEAIEKIKEIIASSQTEGPQSPMMGEEFPGQEFGRASAAFGGIMDTYTGRRKYGLGSFIKKAIKGVKKLASSKIGKMALMYAAGTYLGGTQALGGAGWGSTSTPWKTFGKQLLNPKFTGLTRGESGIGQVFSPKNWSMFQKATPIVQASTKYGAADVIDKANRLGVNPVKSDWKTAAKWILPASIGAGAYTAMAPVEELDNVQGEWDEDKEAFDAYLASLDTGDSYRVPDEYIKSAQGGRIGRQEGGLMNLGGMEKDYRNDGGFVPLGGEEKADDVPARLSRNEFVFTADAVRNAGGGDIDKGAEVMENVMKNLEAGGKVSEESQGQGAQDMFEVSERLSEVV